MINYKKAETLDEILNAFTILKNEFFSFNGDLENFVTKIYKNGICVICEDNGVRGAVAFYANDTQEKVAFITSILVSKSARGKGIGSTLIKIAETISREKEMEKMRLEVNSSNVLARAIYEKIGYIVVSEKGSSIYMEKNLF